MEPIERRRTMRRIEAAGHVRFLTFSCHQRLPLLVEDDVRDAFLDRLATTCSKQHVRLRGWVIMPEHIHMLVFPESDPDIERFTHAVKRPFAEKVLRWWKTARRPILDQLAHADGYRFWQTGGGYDRNLFTRDAVQEKLAYIHDNPVRRGLSDTALDYVWSSARAYAGVAGAKLPCADLPF